MHSAKYIVLIPRETVQTVSLIEQLLKETHDFDFPTVANASFSVKLQWRPYEYNDFVQDFVKRVIEVGIEFVLLIDLLLEIGFGFGWAALMEPEKFWDELREAFPVISLATGQYEQFKVDVETTRQRDNICQRACRGWQKARMAFAVVKPTAPLALRHCSGW